MHARTDEEICVRKLCESAFMCQEFKILVTHGSSEWNEESIKALARVLMPTSS